MKKGNPGQPKEGRSGKDVLPIDPDQSGEWAKPKDDTDPAGKPGPSLGRASGPSW